MDLEPTPESMAIASASVAGAPPPDSITAWSESSQRELEMSVLEEIQDMEDRVCGASLQVKVVISLNVVC